MLNAICIIKNLKDSNFSITTTTYYKCGNTEGDISISKYSTLIDINDSTNSQKVTTCVDNINYIKIEYKSDEYQSIINELSRFYYSPFSLYFSDNKICCCNEAIALYIRDKYLQTLPSNRKFSVSFDTLNTTFNDYQGIQDVYAVYLDFEVAFLSDNINLYLVSLCNICSLIDSQ